MRVLIFVTDDGTSREGTGPTLFVAELPLTLLPTHPRSLSWKYFATVSLDDALLASQKAAIESALAHTGSYLWPRPIHGSSIEEHAR